MECHKCPHAKAVAAGKYQDKPFEKSPCANCGLVEPNTFHVGFEDGEPAGGAVPLRPEDLLVEDVHFPEEFPEVDDRLPLWVMREALVQLLSMQPALRDAVCWRFGGMKYSDIARLQHVSTAAIEVRIQRAIRKWPALRALFAEKAAKQKRRKPYGGGGT